MDIEAVPLGDIAPFPGNPRRGDIEAIRKSLRRFGQQRPVLVQRSTRHIVAGNHLYQAMVAENREDASRFATVDVTWTDLSDVEARAYLVADNQLSARGQNDPDALREWLADLFSAGAIDDALGFDSSELDRFLNQVASPGTSPDQAPPTPAKPWVKVGQLIALGRHRLLCGDAREPESYSRLLAGAPVDIVWTDPPYAAGYVGRSKARTELEGDEVDATALDELLETSLTLVLQSLRKGRAIYVHAHPGAQLGVFLDVADRLGFYRQTLTWVKDTFVVARHDYHSRAEPFIYGWRPGAAHYFAGDRTNDTVWEYPRPRSSDLHPTQKPVELVERVLTLSSRRGELVLDPFAGSGTVVVAAERTSRSAAMMELDPAYCQVIVERWQGLTGGTAEVLTEAPAA